MNERFYKGFETNDTRPEAILIEQFLSLHKPLELAIRWGGKSHPHGEYRDLHQSVAEHVSGMHYLAGLIFERDHALSPGLNRDRIRKMIAVHDMHEGILDDVVRKTPEVKVKEDLVNREIVYALSDIESGDLATGTILDEYESRQTPESVFVKGLDYLEARLAILAADRPEKMKNRNKEVDSFVERLMIVSPLLYRSLLEVNTRIRRRLDEIGQFEMDV